MERIWPRKPRKYFPVRIIAVLSIAVPLSLTPIWTEDSARGAIPELVAFSQAGATAAPTYWVNRILVEDFNDQGDTAAQLQSSSGISSPVGTFKGSGSGTIMTEQQWGGAPCNDCATTSSTTTTTPYNITISSEYNPDPYADPNGNYVRFDYDISPDSGWFLADTWTIYVSTTQDLNGASSVEITDQDGNNFKAFIGSLTDLGTGFELYISYWEQAGSTQNFTPTEILTLNVSGATTETVFTTSPGIDGRVSKFPSIGGNQYGEIILDLASSTTYKYLGFWWSAGSSNNNICLLPETGSTCIAQYNTEDLFANASFNATGVNNLWNERPHYGNPRGRNYSTGSCSGVSDTAGQQGALYDGHCGEPFAFIHIFQDSGFRRVKFSGDSGTGFEFDNVTASTAESWELLDLLPNGTLIGASALPAFDVTSPSVIPVDPRSDSVPFPGVMLGGAASAQPNATLCVTEVDSAGTPVASDPSNILISATVPVGVTSQSSAPRFVYSGTREAIRNLSATIRINNAANSINVVSSESKYLRISVQARTGTGLTTCAGSNNVITAVIVELRPIRLNGSHSVGIAID